VDALLLDIAVRILSSLSFALLAWGGWLCIGATWQGRPSEVPERGEALLS
jgi:TRAP-type C4-dicarboxylate transport system permease small subunit